MNCYRPVPLRSPEISGNFAQNLILSKIIFRLPSVKIKLFVAKAFDIFIDNLSLIYFAK